MIKSPTEDPTAMDSWVRIYDRVRMGEMPPAEEPALADDDKTRYLARLHDALQTVSQTQQATQGRARARRLTRDEYQVTLSELLGVQRDYRDLLPEDGRALGFDKVASALNVSAEHLESYMAAAEEALDDAFAPAEQSRKQRFGLETDQFSSGTGTLTGLELA